MAAQSRVALKRAYLAMSENLMQSKDERRRQQEQWLRTDEGNGNASDDQYDEWCGKEKSNVHGLVAIDLHDDCFGTFRVVILANHDSDPGAALELPESAHIQQAC